MGSGRCEGRVRPALARYVRRDGELLGRHLNSAEHLLWIGSDLVSAAVDGSIAVWAADGRGAPLRWSAHRGPVRALAASPLGEVLISAGEDGLLAIWARGDGSPVAAIPFPGQVRAAVTHPTEPLVAVTGDGGLVHIVELVGWSGLW